VAPEAALTGVGVDTPTAASEAAPVAKTEPAEGSGPVDGTDADGKPRRRRRRGGARRRRGGDAAGEASQDDAATPDAAAS
jgi:hypothetical protein